MQMIDTVQAVDTHWAENTNYPSTLEEIWIKTCPIIHKQWTVEHKNIVTKVCVGYIIRAYTFLDMGRILRENKVPGVREDWRNLRLALLDDCRAVLGIKLMLMRCTARHYNNKRVKLDKEIKDCGLYENDAALFWNLEAMGFEKYLLDVFPTLPNKIPSIRLVQKDCQNVLVDTLDFVNRFVARKHKFIYEGNNWQHGDIVGELQFKIAQAFYHVTPFVSTEHRKNIIKRAAHHHGIKIIKYYTHPDRARTKKVNGVFQNVIQTYNITSKETGEWQDGPMLGQVEKVGRVQINSDNMMELHNFMRSHQKDVPILKLLTLKDDNDFIKHCENKYGAHFSSSEEIYDFSEEDYYAEISEYLKVPIDNVYSVVMNLRERLSY